MDEHSKSMVDELRRQLPGRIEQAVAELVGLQRDAAISLLLEAINDGLADGAAVCPNPCGSCWACRVDKFLRDVGAR